MKILLLIPRNRSDLWFFSKCTQIFKCLSQPFLAEVFWICRLKQQLFSSLHFSSKMFCFPLNAGKTVEIAEIFFCLDLSERSHLNLLFPKLFLSGSLLPGRAVGGVKSSLKWNLSLSRFSKVRNASPSVLRLKPTFSASKNQKIWRQRGKRDPDEASSEEHNFLSHF